MTTPSTPDPADRTELRNYVTIADGARALGISRRTIYNWMATGKLGYKTMPSGRRVIFKPDLLVNVDRIPAQFKPGPASGGPHA